MFARALSLIFVLVAMAAPQALADETAIRDIIAKFAVSRNFGDTEKVVRELAATGDPAVSRTLNALSDGDLYFRKADKAVFIAMTSAGKARLFDPLTGDAAGEEASGAMTKIKVNNGLRRAIREVLGTLTLGSPDAARRLEAAETMFQSPDPANIEVLDAAIAKEADARVRARLEQARAAAVLLSDMPVEDKRAAVTVIAARGDRAALAMLSAFAANADEALQSEIAAAIAHVERVLSAWNAAQNVWFGISLGSVLLLAAIGLAITFGVMGVINMAHGEFIMMGAYTGYVIQQVIPNYTVSILVAIPVAFAVTFAAGVAMERLVIRWLYSRPLETLLATFGISIALQQIAKNVFGTQARPLTSPGWLDGAWIMNDVVSISYIRIAIFVLALIFLAFFLFLMKKTRLGLETRAVTQNPKMAASMGINPDRVNMLTFGLGSGIAGIAGVAIGLYAKVTSELGSDYIVQSFMTVVVGGVGNIWGTLLGATMIGFLQKGIEWLNPSNTLAAQTYMIVFIIIFIQFRPRGIIALKGRAAGD